MWITNYKGTCYHKKIGLEIKNNILNKYTRKIWTNFNSGMNISKGYTYIRYNESVLEKLSNMWVGKQKTNL